MNDGEYCLKGENRRQKSQNFKNVGLGKFVPFEFVYRAFGFGFANGTFLRFRPDCGRQKIQSSQIGFLSRLQKAPV